VARRLSRTRRAAGTGPYAPRSRGAGRFVRWAAPRIIVTAAIYYAAGELGLRLATVHGQVAPLWLPAGAAVVALLLFGPWAAPGITIASFAVNLPFGPSPTAAAAIALGDTAAPVCAYLLLRRYGFHPRLDRLRDAAALILVAALGSMLISATVGATALLAGGAIPPGRYWQTWVVWWTGDAIGVLVGVPFLLALWSLRPHLLRPARWLELVVLSACVVAVALSVSWSPYPLLFLTFPPVIWAALRFGHAGGAPAVLTITTAAAVAATRVSGLFGQYSPFARLLVLQLLDSALAVTALLLAAMVSERDSARRTIDRVAGDLAKMTDELERGQGMLKGMVLDLLRAQRRADEWHRGPPA
jgi:integral membrane sensor domain MASE1